MGTTGVVFPAGAEVPPDNGHDVHDARPGWTITPLAPRSKVVHQNAKERPTRALMHYVEGSSKSKTRGVGAKGLGPLTCWL